MYFCYVDESGDTGYHDPTNPDKTGSPYYVLAGVIVPTDKWALSLDILKSYRRLIARQGFINYDIEFHCAELIDPHNVNAFKQLDNKEKWQLIEDFADIIGKNDFSVIAIVIDKVNSALNAKDYHSTTITRLYQSFDEFLKTRGENGIVLFDRTNEKVTTTHVRKLLGTGSSGVTIPGVRIAKIIEDPFFQVSSESLFIQSADVVAYTLKEKEFPKAARQKFQAHRIFERKLLKLCHLSFVAEEDGIIRL
jgi:hypothetical protein